MDDSAKKFIELLKQGEKIYYKKEEHERCIAPINSKIELGTQDDYTHYLFLEERLGVFLEHDEQSNKSKHADPSLVEKVLNELAQVQQRVSEFLLK